MTTRADPLRHLETELLELERRGLLRRAPLAAQDRSLLVLCSNDYLGYAALPWEEATSDDSRTHDMGAGASRLVSGQTEEHAAAEGAIADWLGTETSLLFSSGYAANVGAIAALAGPGDVVVSDALNHASIIDGCRLSGARIAVVPHGDAQAVAQAVVAGKHARRRWVVTESYFSMEGDTPDLQALRSICDDYDAALYVDEAHAIGVLGPQGRGACAEVGVAPDVMIGTLGKSIGLQGAFVAGSRALKSYLWNRARSFVFSTGISPALAARINVNVLRAKADDAGRERLFANEKRLRESLLRMGLPILPASRGPILPWLVGSAEAAVSLSNTIREQGVLVQAIRPPTVPESTSRLRITATAALSDADIERALAAFARARL